MNGPTGWLFSVRTKFQLKLKNRLAPKTAPPQGASERLRAPQGSSVLQLETK